MPYAFAIGASKWNKNDHGSISLDKHSDDQKENIHNDQEYKFTVNVCKHPCSQSLWNLLFCQDPREYRIAAETISIMDVVVQAVSFNPCIMSLICISL